MGRGEMMEQTEGRSKSGNLTSSCIVQRPLLPFFYCQTIEVAARETVNVA